MLRWTVLLVILAAGRPVSGAEVTWLDGRRETVARASVKGDSVLLSFDKGMRSVSKRRVVRLTGDDGAEIALARQLTDVPADGALKAALEELSAAPPERMRMVEEQLADSMSRAVVAELVELSRSKKADTRARAATTLLLMGLDEPVRAGLAVALGDPDKGVRLRLASTLFEVRAVLRTDDVAPGLEDRDAAAKATFAMVLGGLGDRRAVPVLRTAGLKNSDHHVRESAAETLAELGDDAGVTILIGMLSRAKHPAGASLPERLVVEEKVRVCGHLERLRARKAVPALKQAARSKNAELAAAANRALAAIAAS